MPPRASRKPTKTSASRKPPRKRQEKEVSGSSAKEPAVPPPFGKLSYFRFIVLVFGIWYLVILISMQFRIHIYYSAETLREMASASAALAAIPFAILSILVVFQRQNDDYFKIALAGIAIVFLIQSFMSFFILWTQVDPGDTLFGYEMKILVGIAGGISIQYVWIRILILHNEIRLPFGTTWRITTEEPLLNVFFFVTSFLIIQVSAVQAHESHLLLFVLLGFAGGVIALIALTAIGIVSIFNPPESIPAQEAGERIRIRRNRVQTAALMVLVLAIMGLVFRINGSSTPTLPVFTPTASATPLPSSTPTLRPPSTPSFPRTKIPATITATGTQLP